MVHSRNLRMYFHGAIYITVLLLFRKTNSEGKYCYDCSYRQKEGYEDTNNRCLDPSRYPESKISCPDDKPTCIKATSVTQKFGLVMERGCFPQMPSKCLDLDPLDNSEPTSFFFGAVLADVRDDGENVKFEDVRACFCDWDGCNDEIGKATIREPVYINGKLGMGRSAFGRSVPGVNNTEDQKVGSGSGAGQVEINGTAKSGGSDPLAVNGSGSHTCHVCRLGIECDRMRFAKQQKCKEGSCYVFTKVLGSYNFTQRGCGGCNSFRSGKENVQDNSQSCKECPSELCNSLASSRFKSFFMGTVVVFIALYPLCNFLKF